MRVRESGIEVELAAYGLAKNTASLNYLLTTAESSNHAQRIWALWGALWGPHLDFLLMENDYRIHQREPHVLLPRGKFGPWYKLGGSFKHQRAKALPRQRQRAGQPTDAAARDGDGG